MFEVLLFLKSVQVLELLSCVVPHSFFAASASKILHNHCSGIFLGVTLMPREIYASFFARGWGVGGNKVDYVEMVNDKNFFDFFYV